MKKFSRTLLIALCFTLLCASAFAATYDGYTEDEFNALTETTVIASEDSPTGYYVTFRFPNDGYHLVQIYGEWAFSDISYSSVVTGLNATPEEWQDGYTVWGSWPTTDMELNEETDTWVYTIPLPNGTWKYCFYVYEEEGQEEYTLAYDPNNPPYLAKENDDMVREHFMMSVYVPWHDEKQANTVKVEEEAPRDGENGTVFFETVTLDSGLETSYGVYLPYGFDPDREEPYPILVQFHGGGGFEGSWFNNGAINILDNMIAEGRTEPLIVVTPCGEDFRSEENTQIWERYDCIDYVVNTILPNMVENYNASADPERRAISGLSQGGATIMHAYFNWTEEFNYYTCMSAPMRAGVDPDYTKEALKDVNIFFGVGMYDHVTYRAFYTESVAANESSMYDYIYGIADQGITFRMNQNLPYGHDWVLWRQLLVECLEDFLWQ